jgi:hypothetical protein
VLTKPVAGAATSTKVAGAAIARTQRRAYPDDDHATWTHAALYIGDGYVVEASIGSGVTEGDLLVRTDSHAIVVRRSLSIAPEAARRLASTVDDYCGAPYSLRHLNEVRKALARGEPAAVLSDEDDGYICSELVAAIWADEFLEPLCEDFQPDALIPPAALSFTTSLQDIVSCWWQALDSPTAHPQSAQ